MDLSEDALCHVKKNIIDPHVKIFCFQTARLQRKRVSWFFHLVLITQSVNKQAHFKYRAFNNTTRTYSVE